MSPADPSYPATAGPAYSNIAEAQEKDHKTTYMKVVEVFKEEMKNPIKSGKHKQLDEMSKSFKAKKNK